MSKAPKRGLGRGLSALFEDDEDAIPGADGFGDDKIIGSKRIYLPIENLRPGKYQPRKEFAPQAIEDLAESIKKHGVLQPLIVRPLEEQENTYEIIAGERRWRASQKASIHEVPVVVKDLDDQDTLEIALIENLQREDLNPIEEAEAYQRLIEEFDHTADSLADSLGKSRPHVANTLRLLNLPDTVKTFVLSGKLTAGHARAILNTSNPDKIANEIVSKQLSVRQAEGLARGEKASKGRKTKTATKDVDTRELEKEMSFRLGTKVEISLSKKGGKLIVHYNDLDQLDDYLHRLSGVQK